MKTNEIKEKLIREFSQMEKIEQTARDFYLKIYTDPRVEDEEIREEFKKVAEDEKRHVQIVQKIIHIIYNNL